MAGFARRFDLLATPARRRALFALLYFSEGAPIGFVWWALPTLLRNLGLELGAITTLTTLATLPWILKFLIAPFIDAGTHRAIALKRWILTCQCGMAIVLLPLAFIDWVAYFPAVIAVVVAHAVFAAVQDVGIDTLAIRTVPAAELGRVNGWMQAGMLAGRAGVAAGTTLLAGLFDTSAPAVLLLAALIALPALALHLAVDEPRVQGAPVRLRGLLDVVATRPGFAGMAIALLAGAGFEFFGVSAGPRLVDLGYSDAALAWFYGLFAPAGLALGALAGGMLSDRIGSVRGTGISLLALGGVLTSIAFDDWASWMARSHVAGFAIAYLGTGALTASSYSLLMKLARGPLAATRFSVFMALTNACEAWSGFVGGRFATQAYGLTLLSLAAVACAAVLPLYYLSRIRTQEHGE